MKVKVFIPVGVNRLIETYGPAGCFLNKEAAEKAGKEHCDEFKVFEYEIEVNP